MYFHNDLNESLCQRSFRVAVTWLISWGPLLYLHAVVASTAAGLKAAVAAGGID